MTPPIEVPLRHSIATHLLRRVFLWYLAVAVLVTGGYLASLHAATRADILKQLGLYERTFTHGLELHLWNLERREMDAFTAGMAQLPHVVGVAVTQAETGAYFSTAGVYADPQGRRIGALPPGDDPAAPLIAHRFEIHHATADGPAHLGTATIYSDPALIWEAVRGDYLWVIGAAVVKSIALWLIFLWISRRHLHRPLHDLTQAAAGIHLNHLEPVRIDLADHRHDEIAALTGSFNAMLETLRAARGELEQVNAGLEETVAARTRDLQESRRRLATLIGNLPGIAYRCRDDADWGMEFISAGCLEVTGYPPEAFLEGGEVHFGGLILPEDRTLVREVGGQAIAADRPFHLIYRIARRDGAIRWLWEQGQAIRDAAGRVVALEGFITDITERHQAELDANAARIEAERANRSKSRFLANMSHEFRTPLNAILGFTDILLRRDPRPEQREPLETVRHGGRALLQLVNDVLDIARAEAGKIRLEPQPFRLAPLLEGAMQMVRPLAEAKGLQLHLVLPETSPPALLLDEARLRQVLLNLLGNAIKFTHEGAVTLGLECLWLNPAQSLARLTLTVEDTGIGIPPAERERIFEPFEQQNGQSEALNQSGLGGAGLGLAIARQLVRLMGGELSADGRPGGGSRFTLILYEVEVPATLPKAATAGPSLLRFAPAVVLIADDIPANRRLLRAWLTEAGLHCREAEEGVQVLRIVAESDPSDRPAALLLDLKMPGLDGVEVARRLRAQAGGAPPLIAVTAAALPEEIERHRPFFDAYLTKPLVHAELLECLARFLPHRREAVATDAPGEGPAPLAGLDHATLIPPGVAELNELRQLARIGLTGQIEARAEALRRRDPRHAAFARELVRIAQTFDRKALLDFLAGFGDAASIQAIS